MKACKGMEGGHRRAGRRDHITPNDVCRTVGPGEPRFACASNNEAANECSRCIAWLSGQRDVEVSAVETSEMQLPGRFSRRATNA